MTPPPATTSAPAPTADLGGAGDELGDEPPAGWTRGAWERFRRVNQQAGAAKQAAQAAEERARAAEARAADAEARREQDVAFASRAASAPNLQHASVQRLFREGYAEHAAAARAAGQKPQPFATWLGSDAVRTDPVYAVHLQATTGAPAQPATPGGSPSGTPPAAATAAAPPQPVRVPADPNAGATAAPVIGAGGYRPEDIGAAARSPATFKQHAAAIRAALERDLGVSLGSRPPAWGNGNGNGGNGTGGR